MFHYFYKNGKIVYKRDSVNNLSFLSYHFQTYDSETKLSSEKELTSDCKPITTSNLKSLKHAYKRASDVSLKEFTS